MIQIYRVSSTDINIKVLGPIKPQLKAFQKNVFFFQVKKVSPSSRPTYEVAKACFSDWLEQTFLYVDFKTSKKYFINSLIKYTLLIT